MSRVSKLLNASVEVWRQTLTADGMGGWIQAWSQVSTERARLSQPSSTERVIASSSESQLTHVVYLRDGADVRREDELRQAGSVFRVIAVYEPSVPGTYTRADCEGRQPTQ